MNLVVISSYDSVDELLVVTSSYDSVDELL